MKCDHLKKDLGLLHLSVIPPIQKKNMNFQQMLQIREYEIHYKK